MLVLGSCSSFSSTVISYSYVSITYTSNSFSSTNVSNSSTSSISTVTYSSSTHYSINFVEVLPSSFSSFFSPSTSSNSKVPFASQGVFVGSLPIVISFSVEGTTVLSETSLFTLGEHFTSSWRTLDVFVVSSSVSTTITSPRLQATQPSGWQL